LNFAKWKTRRRVKWTEKMASNRVNGKVMENRRKIGSDYITTKHTTGEGTANAIMSRKNEAGMQRGES
jgi:hypothetical protein